MKILKPIIFSLIPLMILFAMLEVIVRQIPSKNTSLFKNLDSNLDGRECLQSSITLGYEPIPERCGADKLGFRRMKAGKGSHSFQILLLGDSISTHHLWIERMLEKVVAARPDLAITLFNSGVSGYDTCQEATLLIEKGLQIEPDLVLLQTCPNDLDGALIVARLPGGTIRYFVNNVAFDIPAWTFKSRLLTLIELRLGLAMASRSMSADGIGYRRECFNIIRETLVQRQIPQLDILFPVLLEKNEAEGKGSDFEHERLILAWHQSMNIPHVDLRPILSAQGKMEAFRHPPSDIIHPNTIAQQVIGSTVAKILLETPSFLPPLLQD